MESPDDDIDVRAHMNTQIARLWLDDAPDYEWNDQQRANARLIAAAPDLLEALKAMNQAWMCNVEWHDWEASVKQAEAAIAKAEGRE